MKRRALLIGSAAMLMTKSSDVFADNAYGDLSWTVWHEGVRTFDDGVPGRPLNAHTIRTNALAKQNHNSGAKSRIDNLTNNEIDQYVIQIRNEIMGPRELLTHFRWSAIHKGERSNFLKYHAQGNYQGIRSVYYNTQSHNSNTRHLLNGVANSDISSLISSI